MKRFVFRLDRVLDARKIQEEQAGLRLAEARKKREHSVRLHAEAVRRLGEQEKEQRENQRSRFNVTDAMVNHRYGQKLRLDIGVQSMKKAESQAEVELQQRHLREANTNRRALELVRDRQYEDHKVKHSRLEQQALDDIAATQHHRARGEDADNGS